MRAMDGKSRRMKTLLVVAMVIGVGGTPAGAVSCYTSRLGQYVVTNCGNGVQGWSNRNSSGDWVTNWNGPSSQADPMQGYWDGRRGLEEMERTMDGIGRGWGGGGWGDDE